MNLDLFILVNIEVKHYLVLLHRIVTLENFDFSIFIALFIKIL